MLRLCRTPGATFLGIVAVSLAGVACSDDSSFSARFASDFVPIGGHGLSFIGVYKDGRMSADAWDTVGARVTTAFGARPCAPLYDTTLVAQRAELASAIDDYARAEGPGEDLMAQLAQAAAGDILVVLTIAGRLPQPATPEAGAPPPSAPPAMGGRGMRGGRMGGGGARGGGGRVVEQDTNVLEMSASLYSVPTHRAVGLVDMTYSGKSVDDAIDRFAARLAKELAGARCDAWRSVESLDPGKIRDSIER